MNIHYVTGSRADFGLMQRSLQTLAKDGRFAVSIVLTGQAVSTRYGNVAEEVARAGLTLATTVAATRSGRDGLEMALAFAAEEDGMARFWKAHRPDLVLLLGDRGEMLAAAIAAFHLQIPIAHLHGGERSGTLDEAFRHAISKLSTWHFPATDESRSRLIKMGEHPDTVFTIGAPGLVELAGVSVPSDAWLGQTFGAPNGQRVALLLFHPVVDEGEAAGVAHVDAVLGALADEGVYVIVLRPNSDAGGNAIDQRLSQWRGDGVVLDHLDRATFLQTLAAADVLVGNSSSGIIESASLGTPCVNLGSRQDGRERNANVIDCPSIDRVSVHASLSAALAMAGPFENLYGDGKADIRLRDALAALPIAETAPSKRNAY